MHIIINVLEQTDLAETGITHETIMLIILAITALIAGSALFCKMKNSAYNNLRRNGLMSLYPSSLRDAEGIEAIHNSNITGLPRRVNTSRNDKFLIIIPILALVIGSLVPINPANAAPTATGDTVTITVYQGESAAETADINVTGLAWNTHMYELSALLDRPLDAGIALDLNAEQLDNVVQSNVFLSDNFTNPTATATLTAQTTTDAQPGTYEYNLALTPGEKPFDPRLSVDNANSAYQVTNFAGGDLIIWENSDWSDTFSPTKADNTITIGGTTCETTGQGYVTDAGTSAGNVPAIGCVIPDLGTTDAVYDVTVSVSGSPAVKVGELNYSKLPSAFATSCATMQTFASAGCKSSLPQGQSILLEDTRGGADIGYGENNYRVKKMPDDNVWMIDNLAVDPSKTYKDGSPEPLWGLGIKKPICATWPGDHDCTSIVFDDTPDWVDGIYNTANWSDAKHSYGYLYDFCAATADISENCTDSKNGSMSTSILPTGWNLPTGNTSGQFYVLATAIQTTSATNPVYATGAPASTKSAAYNWSFGTSSPFQGVYAGGYGPDELYFTGTDGYLWSNTSASNTTAYALNFGDLFYYIGYEYVFVDFDADYHSKTDSMSVRGVL